jgi:sec-independent protein translocase protein TatB
MLEVGWSELLVIAIVMIVVVGPKDLPKMLRTFAGFAKKARGMANEFQSQFTDAMRDAELDDVRKTIADVRSLNPKNALKDAFDPIRKAGEDVKREMQGVKDGVQNSIASSAPMMAAPAPISETPPIVAPAPSVILPSGAPAELTPVAAGKTKAAPKKAVIAKAAPAKKPAVKKPVAKKTEAKA